MTILWKDAQIEASERASWRSKVIVGLLQEVEYFAIQVGHNLTKEEKEFN